MFVRIYLSRDFSSACETCMRFSTAFYLKRYDRCQQALLGNKMLSSFCLYVKLMTYRKASPRTERIGLVRLTAFMLRDDDTQESSPNCPVSSHGGRGFLVALGQL